MQKSALATEYRIALPLDSGADLTILNFSHEDHGWNFKYRYFAEMGGEEVVNNYSCSLRYKDGIISELSLMMDIIFPDRRGKRFCYGVDISENSRITLTFEYDKVDGEKPYFKLGEVIAGCSKRMNLRDLQSEDKAVIGSINFPFEVKDELHLDQGWGNFMIPFMTSEGETEHFCFPHSIVRPKRQGW